MCSLFSLWQCVLILMWLYAVHVCRGQRVETVDCSYCCVPPQNRPDPSTLSLQHFTCQPEHHSPNWSVDGLGSQDEIMSHLAFIGAFFSDLSKSHWVNLNIKYLSHKCRRLKSWIRTRLWGKVKRNFEKAVKRVAKNLTHIWPWVTSRCCLSPHCCGRSRCILLNGLSSQSQSSSESCAQCLWAAPLENPVRSCWGSGWTLENWPHDMWWRHSGPLSPLCPWTESDWWEELWTGNNIVKGLTQNDVIEQVFLLYSEMFSSAENII